MTYEIPQQLEYQEKIIFNMTFKQILFSLPFCVAALLLFNKVDATIYVKSVIALIPVILGIPIIFFGFDEKIKHFLMFFTFRRAIRGDNKLEKFIGLQKIENDVIITNDERIAVLETSTINFSIKKQEEQAIITQNFRKLLNSIDFPIQILIITEKLDMQEYLKNISNKTKLHEKYKEHLTNTISENNILNRRFYIIIPEKNNLEAQIQTIQEQLKNIRITATRLENKELKQLVKTFYTGKPEGKLESITNEPNNIQLNNKYNRIIAAVGYPRNVEAGFLDKIISLQGDFNISIHIQPEPLETLMIRINKELQKQRTDLYSLEQKGIINPSLEIQHKDTKKVLEELQIGKDKLFQISLYINCKSDNKEDLDILTKKVEAELNSILIIPEVPYCRQMQGLRSCSPLYQNDLKISRNLTTEALSAFFPFTTKFFQFDPTGIWLGLNKNNIPIIRDIFSLNNPNGLILASSGSGKSYMAKLLISRYLLNDTKIIVIDPQGEYSKITKQFNGQTIRIDRKSDTIINPMDLAGNEYIDKRLSLMDLMTIMLGTLTETQKSFLDKGITEAYLRKGINQEFYKNEEPPILEDIVKALKSFEKGAMKMELTVIRSLTNKLEIYTNGVFSFMNKHTKIDFNNNFVCFDISQMPKQVKPALMYLILDYVYTKMKETLERKILVIDEAWSLLSRAEEASYIFEIVKTCRKFNMGLLLINQEAEEMLNSQAGKSVLANTSYTLLMRQKPAVIKSIQTTFDLSESETEHLLTANTGEGILILDDDHTEIKILANEEEHKLITTNADELLEQKKEQSETENKSKNTEAKSTRQIAQAPTKPKASEPAAIVLENKRVYEHSKLNLTDLRYLTLKRYKVVKYKSMFTNKKKNYVIKPKPNESDSHILTCYDVANYLKKYSNKVELFESVKPDVIVEINNKKVAFEIETGKMYKYKRKAFLEKVKQLKNDYPYYAFILLNKDYTTKYKKFGTTFNKRNIIKKLPKYLKNVQTK